MSLDWKIEIKNSSGTWSSEGYIQRPNQDMETTYISTTQKTQLADGSYAFVTPENKRVRDAMTMFFADTTTAFREQIETYIYNGDDIRITAHNGEVFIGRFSSIKRVWFSGILSAFDTTVVFDMLE